MRIIQIIDVRWYNACADFAIKQTTGLLRLGHQVLLLANPGSPPAQRGREAGIDVCEEINFSGWGQLFAAPAKLRRVAATFEADVIFAHRGESHVIAAIAASKLKCRLARFRGDVRPPRTDAFSRRLNEKMTHGIAVSSQILKSRYEQIYKLDGIPVRVIYPGIDVGEFRTDVPKQKLRLKYGFGPDDIIVGIVGRLSPVKGHRYFLEAAKLICLKHPRTQFAIVGQDAQMTSRDLKRVARDMELGNLHFFGSVEDIKELMMAFDIGVIASVGSEMICRVLMEYLAAGLPVAASSINQVAEVISQSGGGKLVTPGRADELANAIISLIEDQGLRTRLAKQGKAWVQNNRSIENLGRETEAFLREVVES